MIVPYERSGRTRQKLRTRDALVAATRTLIAEGASPTVEGAAARADISRTTAYRYFPNQRALLTAAHLESERASLLPPAPPDKPAERLAAMLTELHRIVLATEPQLRMALRLSLDPAADRREITVRRGRAIAWIEEALAPLLDRLSTRQIHRLALAIGGACGIESLVWLTDVGALSRPEAVELMQWSAQGLLRAALRDHRRAAKGKRR